MNSPRPTGEVVKPGAVIPPAANYQVLLATMLGDVYEAIQAASRLQGEVAKNAGQLHQLDKLISHLAKERQELQAAFARFEGVVDRLDGENERFVKLHRATLDAVRSELEFVARKHSKSRERYLLIPWIVALILAGLVGFLLGQQF